MISFGSPPAAHEARLSQARNERLNALTALDSALRDGNSRLALRRLVEASMAHGRLNAEERALSRALTPVQPLRTAVQVVGSFFP